MCLCVCLCMRERKRETEYYFQARPAGEFGTQDYDFSDYQVNKLTSFFFSTKKFPVSPELGCFLSRLLWNGIECGNDMY